MNTFRSRRQVAAPFGAVIFDFFGTLTTAVRRGPAHTAIATALGCDPGRFNAALDRTFPARASGACGSPVDTLRGIAAEQGVVPHVGLLVLAVAARIKAVEQDVTLRRDAVAVLTAVRRLRLRTAVVSDCWYELPALLPRLAVAPLLDVSVFSLDVGARKPSPVIFTTACDRLGVPPRRCLYIGDGGGRELTGARSVGMTAVRLAAADLATHLTFDPEIGWDGLTVDDLTGLLPLLAR